MPADADLDAIVAAARAGALRPTRHYSVDRAGQSGRPLVDDVLLALTEGAPRIIDDDHGLRDPRGAVSTIACEAPNGDPLIVRVNYTNDPMQVVTAWVARSGQDA